MYAAPLLYICTMCYNIRSDIMPSDTKMPLVVSLRTFELTSLRNTGL